MLQKIVSIIYIIGGLSLIILGFLTVLEDRETYRLILGFETESKFGYLLFRIAFGTLVIYAGITRIRRKDAL